eukprot:TRINITY_DN2325_c0_g1_i3.p1 TRINITY_DN2325_c0_g1~~TRINITY_DN2325_c0_g1_i3.p1  ORF type:complete len:424 (-),score=71.45 TRINITY_DN2325_c0_g1_i3:46-1317(-)
MVRQIITFWLAAATIAAEAARTRVRRKRGTDFLAATGTTNQTLVARSAVSTLYPFYHTTDGIHAELLSLASRCPGMTLESRQGTGANGDVRSIDVVTIKTPDASPVNRNFFLFGEHARELISAESGLHFVKTLCGETGLSGSAKEVLKDSEFQIVVNGNPASRSKVEDGDFCLRVNPSGVDLNRNWDEKWLAAAEFEPQDTNPGQAPFSEPETRVFKKLVQSYEPTTFLTVHSGTKGMYMPWAYDTEHLATRNEPEMMSMLKELDREHCQCPYGAAGKEVGYSCPGTCLDWVYDQLKTPYAFAFEIYAGPEYAAALRERWEEKLRDGDGAFYQLHSNLAHSHFRDLFEEHPSGFIQLRSKRRRSRTENGRAPDECFEQFNPRTSEEYSSTVENWSSAYLQMSAQVARRVRAGRDTVDAANETQ